MLGGELTARKAYLRRQRLGFCCRCLFTQLASRTSEMHLLFVGKLVKDESQESQPSEKLATYLLFHGTRVLKM